VPIGFCGRILKLIDIFCMYQVIEKSTEKVLSDKSWLEAPEEVVLKVLQIKTMQMTEAKLFASLVKWGQAQVKDEADVRAKIDKCLKLIQFCTMDCVEFSTLCCNAIIPLTSEEKHKIFLCISQKNYKFLPDGFQCSEKTGIFRKKPGHRFKPDLTKFLPALHFRV
jgi:hypothetical protein